MIALKHDIKPEVVFIDDSIDELEWVSDALFEIDPTVSVRHILDGRQAIDYFEQLKQRQWSLPLFIILDLNLPGVSGLGILQNIKALFKPVPFKVFVFSGSENPDDEERCLTKGADGYFVKPWDCELYEASIRSMFDASR